MELAGWLVWLGGLILLLHVLSYFPCLSVCVCLMIAHAVSRYVCVRVGKYALVVVVGLTCFVDTIYSHAHILWDEN